MKRAALVFLAVLLTTTAVPRVASACERCLGGQCFWVGPPDGGYCYYVYPDDCTFEPSLDCNLGCANSCSSTGSSDQRAGEKTAAETPLIQQWQVASVQIDGTTRRASSAVAIADFQHPHIQQ